MNTEQLQLLLAPLQARQEEAKSAPSSPSPPNTEQKKQTATAHTEHRPAPWQGDSDAGLILPLILILMTDGNNFGLILALLYILM